MRKYLHSILGCSLFTRNTVGLGMGDRVKCHDLSNHLYDEYHAGNVVFSSHADNIKLKTKDLTVIIDEFCKVRYWVKTDGTSFDTPDHFNRLKKKFYLNNRMTYIFERECEKLVSKDTLEAINKFK